MSLTFLPFSLRLSNSIVLASLAELGLTPNLSRVYHDEN